MKNKLLFHQLCSSLDELGDTCVGIIAYLDESSSISKHMSYIIVYGVIQALILQQDSVFHLCEALNFPRKIDNYPQLKEIREIRNDSVGHPTKRNKKIASTHHISRVSLSREKSQLISFYEDGTKKVLSIVIPKLIEKQQRDLISLLNYLISELRNWDKNYREKFKMKKLNYIFDDMDYPLQKLFDENIRITGIETAQDILDRFQSDLKERELDIDVFDSIEFIYLHVRYALELLNQNNVDEKMAYILAMFIRQQIDNLKAISLDIDRQFET